MDLKGLYHMPRGAPFMVSLARGLLDKAGGDPLALADMCVLLPNHRSVRSLREAFLSASDGAATLLPRMVVYSEADEAGALATLLAPDGMFPPIETAARMLQLSRFVQMQDAALSPATALSLACDLARLLDELAAYGKTAKDLAAIDVGTLSSHWEHTLRFLTVLTELWPNYLATIERSDPAAYRVNAIKRLAKAWQETPPPFPVVMAGMARAEPAVMELAHSILQAGGSVVLPAFDTNLLGKDWVELDKVHPDALLQDVMIGLGATRQSIAPWPGAPVACRAERLHWLSTALQPAELTGQWADSAAKTIDASAFKNIDLINCADEMAEAETVALLIRQELQVKEQTIALVTPDRALARRVAALLRRWDIAADDSSGVPVMLAPLGVYLRAVARAAEPDAAPADILALLKHQLCGVASPVAVMVLETKVLRGQFPAPGLAAVRAQARKTESLPADVMAMLARVQSAVQPLAELLARPQADARAIITTHIQAAETLAATADKTAAERLWQGAAAEAASSGIADLLRALPEIYTLPLGEYLPWVAEALAGKAVRVPYGLHPRVAIHGLIEARLQQADVMIVAGLNEGTWPKLPDPSPWLNRAMRLNLGLPDTETHIAQQAHDFVSAAVAQRVYLTRALRSGGVPTVAARWVLRLQAVLATAKLDKTWLQAGEHYGEWAALLDKAPAEPPLATAPRFAAPVTARPRSAYVTEIELLMSDPYAYYGKCVLELRALRPLVDEPNHMDRGTFIHKVLAAWMKEALDDAALPAAIDAALLKYENAPTVAPLWRAWALDIAPWFKREQTARAAGRAVKVIEEKGTHPFEGIKFTVQAKPDRIDTLDTGAGGAVVIDYKTGSPPTGPDLRNGHKPQLPLEALIVRGGGFKSKDVPAGQECRGEFWQLASTAARCDVKEVTFDYEQVAEGLRELVAAYVDRETAYVASKPHPHRANDYGYLARTAAWAGVDEGEDAA